MKPIEKRLDTLWSAKVMESSRCAKCGQPAIDPHHIFGRGKAVRWNLKTGMPLCRNCHIEAHGKNQAKFRKWAREYLGADLYDYLKALSRQIARNIDYEEIERTLK